MGKLKQAIGLILVATVLLSVFTLSVTFVQNTRASEVFVGVTYCGNTVSGQIVN